jgi:hypothetical protein
MVLLVIVGATLYGLQRAGVQVRLASAMPSLLLLNSRGSTGLFAHGASFALTAAKYAMTCVGTCGASRCASGNIKCY